MKNILVLAHDDAGQESRLQFSLGLARAMNGHLTCVDVTRQPVFMEDYVSTAGGMIALVDEQQREFENADRLRKRMAIEDVSWEVVQTAGDISDALIERAQLADVVVLSRRRNDASTSDTIDVASDLVMNSRASIVAVPKGKDRFYPTGPMLVAWNGSPPAIAALKAAIPVLSVSTSVILFAVDEDDNSLSCDEAASYLSRYGIKAQIERKDSKGVFPPDFYIRNACKRHQVSLCIMGAYGRPRRIENFFGGVTRRMLASTECALMIAH